jgi:hypothetical protein
VKGDGSAEGKGKERFCFERVLLQVGEAGKDSLGLDPEVDRFQERHGYRGTWMISRCVQLTGLFGSRHSS